METPVFVHSREDGMCLRAALLTRRWNMLLGGLTHAKIEDASGRPHSA